MVATDDGSPGMLNRIDVDRAAEQRAPVHARKQDDRRHRLHAEGQRQQQRDAVRRAQARQHADEYPEQHADHHQREVRHRDRDRETVQQRSRFSIARPSEPERRAEQAVRQRDLEHALEHEIERDRRHDGDDGERSSDTVLWIAQH